MKRARFTEEQIIPVLKEHEAGAKTADLARKHGVVAALCEGLREALDYFGGVPEQVLFDNAKTIVIERDAYGAGLHRWNDRLLKLAEESSF